MPAANRPRSALLIGGSQRVLDQAVAILRDLGYTAQGTNDFFIGITGRFDVTSIGLVALGHLIPPDRRAELKEQIGVINPQVIFLPRPSTGRHPGTDRQPSTGGIQRRPPRPRPRTHLRARRPFDPADPA